MTFDNKQTVIAKGIAVLLLIWHHLFLDCDYSLYANILFLKSIPAEAFTAKFAKVCVPIFFILSGYGLDKSWKNQKKANIHLEVKSEILFVKNHLLKLMLNYWFIFVLYIITGIIIGISFWQKYECNFLFAATDFLGLAFLFDTPTANPTWWFMSDIIIFYIIFPVLEKINDYCSEILICIGLFFLFFSYRQLPALLSLHLLSFFLGIYLSTRNFFEHISNKLNTLPKQIFSLLLFVYATFMLSKKDINLNQSFALAIITSSFFIFSKIPAANKILFQLGKYSGEIFMFHTFILLYFNQYIYCFRYSPIIFIIFSTVCYLIAVTISYLKKITRYNLLINKLTKPK